MDINDNQYLSINIQVNISKLTDRQRIIYEKIKNGIINDTVNGTVNAQNLSAALGISLRTTKRDLYVLRDMNLIQYIEVTRLDIGK